MTHVKAGDVLYEAYNAAVRDRNSDLLYRIADYESYNDLIRSLSASDIRRTASNIQYRY